VRHPGSSARLTGPYPRSTRAAALTRDQGPEVSRRPDIPNGCRRGRWSPHSGTSVPGRAAGRFVPSGVWAGPAADRAGPGRPGGHLL